MKSKYRKKWEGATGKTSNEKSDEKFSFDDSNAVGFFLP